jgi:hypothetical protein
LNALQRLITVPSFLISTLEHTLQYAAACRREQAAGRGTPELACGSRTGPRVISALTE